MLNEDKGFSERSLHEIMTAPPMTKERAEHLVQQRIQLRRKLEEKRDRTALGLDHWNG
jgi:Spy/CpxP family protein refolding chaperone